MATTNDQQPQGPLMTPEFLRKVMVAAINQCWEGKMAPDVCTAVATAAQAFADLHRLEELEEELAMLRRQLMLQQIERSA